MRSLLVVTVVFSLCLVGQSAKLPSSWGRCHKSDKEFPECLRRNIEGAIRSLNKPNSELGLDTFDPLDIPELYIGEGTGPVNVAQHFKRVKLHGLTNEKVYSADVDFDKKEIRAYSLNPELRLEGEYEMKGRILLLPIVGKGPCNVTLYNMKIHHVLKFDYVERKGKTYMRAVDFTTQMDPDRVTFQFDNLFDGDKQLGDNINKVLNENGLEVFNDVKPGYEKGFALIFKGMANRILPKVAVKDIFLD